MRKNKYIRHWDKVMSVYIYKHREVMEKHLGRSLVKGEHVHHINGNPIDNRIENLEVVSNKEHMKEHHYLTRKNYG